MNGLLTIPHTRALSFRSRAVRFVALGSPVVAALLLIVSGVTRRVDLLLVGAPLCVLAGAGWGWRQRRLRNGGDTLLLVGSDAGMAVIAAFLTPGPRSMAAARRSAGQPTVVRVPDLATAAERLVTLQCREVIVEASALAASMPFVDRSGRSVRVLSSEEKLARLFGRVCVEHLSRHPWDSGQERAWDRLCGAGKRAFDVVVALVLLPVWGASTVVLAAMLVVLGGERPIVADGRLGRDNRPFRLYLLRTTWPVASRSRRDAAVARVGRLLRATHLDCLPAIWNVLRGDLSFVGPRPETGRRIRDLEAAVPTAVARQWVRPGLVSLAQVRFRYSDARRDTMLALEYDLYYVRYRSAALDARILARATWIFAKDFWIAIQKSTRGLMSLVRRRMVAMRDSLPQRASRLASVALPRDEAGRTFQATLIVGAGSGGRQLARELRRDCVLGLWPVAFVDDDRGKIGTRIDGLPVLGDTEVLRPIVKREQIETIVIAIPSASELTLKRIADRARQTEAQILTMPDIGTILRGGTALSLQTVPMTDVLGRPLVEPNLERCRAFLAGKRVLITGAAGSIGSELARQVAQAMPSALYGLDINESDLYDLANEIRADADAVPMTSVVASVTDHHRIAGLLRELRPEIIFHAAAYKHVPLMEDYPAEAVEVNTIGTYRLAQAAAAAGVQRFVLVSTDKAVRPSSVMGATKRLAELSLRAVAAETGLSACAVRFGNVLGSRGSVIPLFEVQIARGGPVTVTHPEMKRYFMTIPEAVGLIIEAGALGDDEAIYILDMGEEVAIKDLAERLIRLKGLRVGTDIAIVYTGMRPGEKLRESLSLDFETASPTEHEKIRIFHERLDGAARASMSEAVLERLAGVASAGDAKVIRQAVMDLVSAADGGVYAPPEVADHQPSPVTILPVVRPLPAPISYGAADD